MKYIIDFNPPHLFLEYFRSVNTDLLKFQVENIEGIITMVYV